MGLGDTEVAAGERRLACRSRSNEEDAERRRTRTPASRRSRLRGRRHLTAESVETYLAPIVASEARIRQSQELCDWKRNRSQIMGIDPRLKESRIPAQVIWGEAGTVFDAKPSLDWLRSNLGALEKVTVVPRAKSPSGRASVARERAPHGVLGERRLLIAVSPRTATAVGGIDEACASFREAIGLPYEPRTGSWRESNRFVLSRLRRLCAWEPEASYC